MRISPSFVGKALLGVAVLAVFGLVLQWIGSPTDFPTPPHTLYSEIAHLVG